MKGKGILPLILILSLASCTTGKSISSSTENPPDENLSAASSEEAAPGKEEAAVVPESVRDLPFEEAGIGFTGPGEKEYLSFFSSDEMERYIPAEDMFRDIDFSREMVLACFMGEQSSGGYMCRVIRLEESSEMITAYVEISEPLPGDLVAQMITRPWSAVAVPLSGKKITWTEVREER